MTTPRVMAKFLGRWATFPTMEDMEGVAVEQDGELTLWVAPAWFTPAFARELRERSYPVDEMVTLNIEDPNLLIVSEDVAVLTINNYTNYPQDVSHPTDKMAMIVNGVVEWSNLGEH